MTNLNKKTRLQHNAKEKMKLHPFSLSFSGNQKSLESEFRKNYFNTYLYLFRICHIISIFFYGAAIILDYRLFPGQLYFLAIIRFGVVIPIFLIGLMFSFHKSYEKLWPLTNNFYVVLTGAGFILMIAYCPPPHNYSYYAGVIVCLFFGYTFIRSRFLMASAAGCTLTLLYIAVSLAINTPGDILARSLFFVFTVNILGMIICYSMELSARKNFFLKTLLEKERNRVEETNEMLENLVAERTAKLFESNRHLKEKIKEKKELELQLQQAHKMRAIGTLAGGIAHDFNNILGAIMGYAELAQLNTMGNQKVKRYIDQLYQASKRAKDIVRQILAFSRQGNSEKIPIDMGSVIKDTLKLLRASFPTTIEINQNVKLNLAAVEADPTQIQQVVLNLFTNALHAMEHNGGQLFIDLSPVAVTPEDTTRYHDIGPGNYLQLTVRDTGHGMDADIVSRIFEPYFTTKDIGKGTGMGLAMVYGIVKNHGGDILVNSDPGKGTSFYLLFPIAERQVEDKEEKPESRLPEGNEQILLVDDEKLLIDIGKNMLEGLGYRVEAHNSPLDALNVFRSQPDKYDMIITDMTMPKMTGEQLAWEAQKIRPDIPIILCTGYSERATSENASSTGISKILIKPVAVNDLATAVREVLLM